MEVLIAMVLSSGAIMLTMRTIDFIKSAQFRSQNYSKAHNIAVTVLEQLIATFPTDTKLTSGNHSQQFDTNGNEVTVGGNFTARWTVNLDTPISKVMKIELNVSWQENGAQRTVSFVTFRES